MLIQFRIIKDFAKVLLTLSDHNVECIQLIFLQWSLNYLNITPFSHLILCNNTVYNEICMKNGIKNI